MFRLYRLFCLAGALLFGGSMATGQDVRYARGVLAELCAENMHGRGYTRRGDTKASAFIRKELKTMGLTPLTADFFQPFHLGVNTFPGPVKLTVNETELEAGRDFMIDPSSGSCKGSFETVTVSIEDLIGDKPVFPKAGGKVLIVDARKAGTLSADEKALWNSIRRKLFVDNVAGLKAVIEITSEKLTHGIASVANPIPWFRVKADAFPANAKNVKIQVDNRLLAKHETRNVVATILGTKYPDSMFVFTAHYDHLGTMGRNVFFPGANDNASGVSMMLTLARYFKDHPLPYTLVFMAFSGEELGLLGSSYFADNPLIDLKAVKFLVNLDMVGNGSEGITVVNGGVFHEWYSTLVYINDAQQLLATVKKRGEACNSDHCPFYRKGVPSFFIYTMGGISAYHDLDDTPENLSFKGFEGLMLLLTEFARRID